MMDTIDESIKKGIAKLHNRIIIQRAWKFFAECQLIVDFSEDIDNDHLVLPDEYQVPQI